MVNLTRKKRWKNDGDGCPEWCNDRREGKLHTNAIVKVEVRVTGLLATTEEASKDS